MDPLQRILFKLPFELRVKVMCHVETFKLCYFLTSPLLHSAAFEVIRQHTILLPRRGGDGWFSRYHYAVLEIGSKELDMLRWYIEKKYKYCKLEIIEFDGINDYSKIDFLLEKCTGIKISFSEISKLASYNDGRFISKISCITGMSWCMDQRIANGRGLLDQLGTLKQLDLIVDSNTLHSPVYDKFLESLLMERRNQFQKINLDLWLSVPYKLPKYLRIFNDINCSKEIRLELKESRGYDFVYPQANSGVSYKSVHSVVQALGSGNIVQLTINLCSFCTSDMKWIQNMPNLRDLAFLATEYSGRLSASLYLRYNENPFVERLGLTGLDFGNHHGQIDKYGEPWVPVTLKEFSSLQKLELIRCNFEGVSNSVLFLSLPNSTTDITLSNCRVDWSEIKQFAPNVDKVTILDYKHIEFNEIIKKEFEVISLLSTNIKMYSLNRWYN
ncbi:hypothetical protein CANARDRAFT_5517 [[Candida] arabinofermentans NRRL YB-2248]|uniref:Uncharacterized protein n=1 Tax=[Candida] arabinofermentans NRRL YB-2248 TaxID=983967 RepID=A0A1E4T8Z0_9ASCO|nr:hypothetical protein CANARDRAFT_5517 [[Candida] arabinofermentans NRRL YB-2248]